MAHRYDDRFRQICPHLKYTVCATCAMQDYESIIDNLYEVIADLRAEISALNDKALETSREFTRTVLGASFGIAAAQARGRGEDHTALDAIARGVLGVADESMG